MVKLKYSQNELLVEADTLDDTTVNGIIKLLDKVTSITNFKPVAPVVSSTETVNQVEAQVEHNVSIRKRLPNSYDDNGNEVKSDRSNVIDISAMQQQNTVKPTAHHNFRCPSCYQSAVTVVNDSVILRDIYKGGVFLANGVDLENFDYKEAAGKAIEKVTLVADGVAECHCPRCGADDVIEKWVDAYKNPLKYNENEVPCPICGSETVLNVNKSNKRVQKCENKECGFELELEG